MSKNTTTEPEETAEFDLKHRVTGAAVLLFLGALVFPWLLGPPSEASKLEAAKEVSVTSEVEAANIITDIGDSRLASATNDIEETVYISKITPLDAKGNSGLIDAANQAAQSALDSKTKADVEPDAEAVLQELVKEANSSIDNTAEDKSSKEVAAKEKVVSASAVTTEDAAKQEQAKREKELQQALAAETQSQKAQELSIAKVEPAKVEPARIDVGWVVQVGLFTEKSRAIALTSELKNKGFSASSSVVDTNRGKNTGTRVWLGPFTKRSSAIAEQKRLKSKAGKEGFIRVYP